MTIEEFAIETKTLEDFYNKDYNQTQRSIWFDEIQEYSRERYHNAIIDYCKENQYRPTLSQMLETIKKTRMNPVGQKNIERVECELCKGTGYLIYKKNVNGIEYEYVCLCNCQNAIGKEYDGTKIADKEHRSKYYIEKAENVFLGKSV